MALTNLASAAAQGVKNYVTSGTNFDNNSTAGWSVIGCATVTNNFPASVGTATLPFSASNGGRAKNAATLSASVDQTNRLSGTGSLSWGASGATVAGEMLISDALSLDSLAQASVQTFSFYYKVLTGASNLNLSGTSSNSLGVAVYDVTNGAWLQPAGVFNLVQSSGVGKASGTFQVPSNCSKVQLAIYTPNAVSGAFSLVIDEVVVGPQTVQYGAPTSDWQSYTPTGSFTTNTTYTGKWRRVGDSAEFEVKMLFGGAPNSTVATITLPFGWSIDPNKVNSTQQYSTRLGDAEYLTSGIAPLNLQVVQGSGLSTVQLLWQSSAVNGSQSTVTQASPITIASGDQINARFQVPIAGWSSSVQFSNDTDTRVVAASYAGVSSTSLTASTAVSWVNKLFDTHSALSGTTYTVPVSGIYRVSLAGIYTTTGPIDWALWVDGALKNYIMSSLSTFRISGTVTVNVSAGQTITIRPVTSGTLADAITTYLSVERLSGPSAIAATETVAAKFNTSTTTLTSGSNNVVVFTTKTFDTHNSYNTSTGVYTIPVSGFYRVSAYLITNNTVGTGTIYLSCKQNSTFFEMNRFSKFSSASAPKTLVGSILLDCKAGDQISIIGEDGDSNSLATGSPSSTSFATIEKLK